MANILYRITSTATVPSSTTVKNAPLTNAEIDGNMRSLKEAIEDTNIAKYDAATANFTGDLQVSGNSVLTEDLLSSPPGDIAQYGDTTANFTGTLQNGGSNVLVESDSNVTKYNDVNPSFTDDGALRLPVGTDAQRPGNTSGYIRFNSSQDYLELNDGSEWREIFDSSNADIVNYSDEDPSFTDSGALGLPSGTEAQRPGVPAEGQIRYNTDDNDFEGYNGSGWSKFGLLVESPAGTYTLTGNLVATGDITTNSDERLKSNITPIESALEKINALSGVYYDKDDSRHIGLIAQDVEQVVPEVVLTAADEMQTKSIAYGNMVGLLIEAIKEQQEQIEYLKSKLL